MKKYSLPNLLLGNLILFSFALQAKTLYISPSGSDDRTGDSPEQALATLAAALPKAEPGDEILLLAGTYYGTQRIWNCHGAPDRPITIRSAADNCNYFAVIDAAAQPALNSYRYGLWFDDASWIEIINLKFRNCWTDIVYIERSSYLSFIGCYFYGGRKVIYPKGNTCHHFLVANCYWEQDERVYTTFDWDEMHHGSLAYYNGGLFAAQGIGGGFIIRNNTIKNVFNGIRFTGDKNNRRLNANGEIYGNVIINTRDNAFEPEDVCSNLHFYHNRLINSHAFISIDMVRGGPIYFYGNVGWQTEYRGHEWTIFKFRGYESDKPPAPLDEPLYVFNNSWYVPLKAFGGSSSQYRNHHLRHFNNAYFFSNQAHLGLAHWGEDYLLDFDCSNTPFPFSVLQNGQEAHGLFADPMFRAKEDGDFALDPHSPCVDAGTIVSLPQLQWMQTFDGLAPDIGAYEGSELIQGPPFRYQQPPGGCYYTEMPRIVRHKIKDNILYLYFSEEILPESISPQAIHLYQNGCLVPVQFIAFPHNHYEVQIATTVKIDADQLFLRMDPLPLGKNGQTATHWASTIAILPQSPTLLVSYSSEKRAISPPFCVYPNPCNSRATILFDPSLLSCSENEIAIPLSIHAVHGGMIATLLPQKSGEKWQYLIDVDRLSSGTYIALIRYEHKILRSKFVVLK